ncbi:CBS domain-containing protein [Kitasatospora acidiphila]|uniref:CBS domain-containing protein n=1 Tax=Kitasatospora acidiphila TaxID=2567942 RepID=UPI003C727FAF
MRVELDWIAAERRGQEELRRRGGPGDAPQGLKRLPVVDVEGGLVGIVSRCDLLEPFLRADAESRREISEEVLGRAMGVPPHDVDVAVEDGVVTLPGTLQYRSLIPVLEGLCRSFLPGGRGHAPPSNPPADRGIPARCTRAPPRMD